MNAGVADNVVQVIRPKHRDRVGLDAELPGGRYHSNIIEGENRKTLIRQKKSDVAIEILKNAHCRRYDDYAAGTLRVIHIHLYRTVLRANH